MKRFQVFIYPFLVHFSIYLQISYWVTCLLPALFYLSFGPFHQEQNNLSAAYFKKFVFILLIILAVFSIRYQNHSLLYLPPLLISLLILTPFALSVRTGYTPLITQFYFLTEKTREPSKIQYTRRLTWIWIIIISLMVLEILLLSLFAPLEIWSLFTNFINYLLLLSFMLIEWGFRVIYFKEWVSPVLFFKQLILIDHHQLLKKE